MRRLSPSFLVSYALNILFFLDLFALLSGMADDLAQMGDMDGACAQLLDALRRSDGVSPPPDFVAGDPADDLATAITEARDELGCAE